MPTLYLIHLFATLSLVGLIWVIQVVQYPLFDRIGAEQFVQYEAAYQRKISWIVGPLMLLELLTALAFLCLDTNLSRIWSHSNMSLILLIWLSTWFVQVPLHQKLSTGFDQEAYVRLVRSNWIRTILWTARGILVLSPLAEAAEVTLAS